MSIQGVFIYLRSDEVDFLRNQESLVSLTIDKIQACLPENEPIFVPERAMSLFTPGNIVPLDCSDAASGIKKAFDYIEKNHKGQCEEWEDTILFFDGLMPLFDGELFKEMYSEHYHFLSAYTLSDNVPPGFLPDIISRDFVSDHLQNHSMSDIPAYVISNLEKLDAEVFFRLPDMRPYRLDFTTRNSRSRDLLCKSLERNKVLDYKSLASFIANNSDLLHINPSYIELEISTKSMLKPVFYPDIKSRQNTPEFISKEVVDEILKGISTLYENDVTVSLSGPGEPLFHPDCVSIIQRLLADSNTAKVIVETYGVDINENILLQLAELKRAKDIIIILRMSAMSQNVYKEVYGYDGFDSVMETVDKLEKGKWPFDMYVEMFRINEVMEEIPLFFERFEQSRFKPLLQKYNRYIDLLPERRISDLTPLKQDFCWHLSRDFYIAVNGSVPLCKQDFYLKTGQSLFEQSFREIWDSRVDYHRLSVAGDHEGIPMPCLQCDEWYTFNG